MYLHYIYISTGLIIYLIPIFRMDHPEQFPSVAACMAGTLGHNFSLGSKQQVRFTYISMICNAWLGREKELLKFC